MAKFKTKRTAKEIQMYVRHFNKHIMFNWIARTWTCDSLRARLVELQLLEKQLRLLWWSGFSGGAEVVLKNVWQNSSTN